MPIVVVVLICVGGAGFFVWRRRNAPAGSKVLTALRSGPTAVAQPIPVSSTHNPLMLTSADGDSGPSADDIAQASAGLPDGWSAVWSKSKSAFYWRAAGGDTTWTKPV